jgi:hypothetical protein
MRIKFLRNAEYPQIKPNGEPDPERSKSYKAGETYEVTDDHGNRWIRRNAAVLAVDEARKVKGEDADESPLSDENVTDALDLITRMKSKDRLQHIIANDKRATVQKAAQARLDVLNKEGATIEHMVPHEKR